MQDMVPSVEGYLPQQPARPSGEQTDVQGIDISPTLADNTLLEMPRHDMMSHVKYDLPEQLVRPSGE